jgi:hypothetical protein
MVDYLLVNKLYIYSREKTRFIEIKSFLFVFTVCQIEFFHLLLDDEIANEQMNHRMD